MTGIHARAEDRSAEGAHPMLGSGRAAMPSSRMRSIIIGLVGSVALTVLLAWRFGATWKEILHGAASTWHVLLFILGSWLLYQDIGGSGPAKKVMNGLGLVFTIFRTISYARLSIMKDLPAKIASLFDSSATGYLGFSLYCAASLFMLVLLRRTLPRWACTFVGVLHGAMFSWISYRFVGPAQPTVWQVLRMVAMGQLGMFAPHLILTHPYMRTLVARAYPQRAGASALRAKAAAKLVSIDANSEVLSDALPADMSVDVSAAVTAAGHASADTGHGKGGHTGCHMKHGYATNTAQQAGGSMGQASCSTPSGQASKWYGQRMAGSSSLKTTAATVETLTKNPYRPHFRLTHKVVMKLDTDLPCSSLPADMAQQLQRVLKTNMCGSLSLSITDVAVRPGCICITMKMEEQLPAPYGESTAVATGSQLHLDALAQMLLPQLQGMLSKGPNGAAVNRSTVQLDDSVVACVWRQDKQAWDVQARCTDHVEQTESKPWLGIATALALQATPVDAQGQQPPQPLPASPTTAALSVLAEVQLRGIGKPADVEGWTPPQQHQDSEFQWQLAGSKPTMKLLARACGGYLPTQVLGMKKDAVSGSVTAKVLIQLHEHQLTRHHEGGAPSTLLLMDLELWQNEVLLSSSPLLSLPASPATADGVPEASDWWWGAADSTVSAAMAELQGCVQECMRSMSDEDMPAAIQTLTHYIQDLAVWLSQVQRMAHASCLCQCSPAEPYSSHKHRSARSLQAPTLDTAACKQLGDELMQYAAHLGWPRMLDLLTQQMRSVVMPACHATTASPQWVVSAAHATKAAVFGWPCHLDEQLYKQQLEAHLRPVLPLSCTATTLIGVVMLLRACASQDVMFILMTASWALPHAAAMLSMLCAHATQQPNARQKHVKYALRMLAGAYMAKAVMHPAVALLLSKPACKEMYTHVFLREHLWGAMKLVTLICDQVPASVLLPAPVVTCMAVLLEFPALLLDVMHSSGWHPITCVVTTFMLAVGARFVLDAQFRLQLTRPTRTGKRLGGTSQPADMHAKTD